MLETKAIIWPGEGGVLDWPRMVEQEESELPNHSGPPVERKTMMTSWHCTLQPRSNLQGRKADDNPSILGFLEMVHESFSSSGAFSTSVI